MSYFISKETNYSLADAENKAREELKKEGFGVLTEIDVKETFKNKLGVDFRPYKILGACNPQIAYKALSSDRQFGVMLPCNVVIQESESGGVLVSAVDPVGAMASIENIELKEIADEVRLKLNKVIENI